MTDPDEHQPAPREEGASRPRRGFAIREAVPGDTERLLAAYEWDPEPAPLRPVGDEQAQRAIAAAIDSEGALVLVAENERGELVGVCLAHSGLTTVRFGERVTVDDLLLRPGAEAPDLVDALLERVREWAGHRRATHVKVIARVEPGSSVLLQEASRHRLFGWTL